MVRAIVTGGGGARHTLVGQRLLASWRMRDHELIWVDRLRRAAGDLFDEMLRSPEPPTPSLSTRLLCMMG